MLRDSMFRHGFAAALLGFFPAIAPAQVPAAPVGVRPGAVLGTVVDTQTGQALSAVRVRLRELERTDVSHGDGTFHFDGIPPGTYTIAAERLGYAPAQQTVSVAQGDTALVRLALSSSAIEIAGIVVTGAGSERSASETYRPTTVLSDTELRRKLSTSVAATLAGEPGISQRYNGPAAAQPVIRGLSGDRVLVLEDGQRVGDISTTSADHAVAIEPLTAERIEVVRGPAGLLYGSNALGGVINVIREEVPRTVPERISGLLTSQVETVNQGLTGGVSVTAPAGPFAVRGELSGRIADNTQTPLGELPTTQIDAYNGGVGASWVSRKGYAGGALRDHWMRYGVPGTFNGEVIPGGHADGVEIEQRRTAMRFESALRSGIPFLESIELDANHVRLDQTEFELGGSRGPVVGTQFRQFTNTGELIARHRHRAGGLRLRGAAGLWALDKSFSTAGLRTGSRPADQLSLAGFIFEELGRDPFRLEIGARYDWTRISPLEEEQEDIGFVRTREFGAVSGSAAVLYEVRSGVATGISLSRAFRTPAIEELFSNGPHLADYSYNVGNPDLEAEFGFGTDLFLRATLPRFNGELAVFRNAINDYIYYAPTGALDPRFGRFPVYRAAQSDAVLTGFEGRVQWEVLPTWVLDGNGSYVRGTREDQGRDEPLPAIPPLHGSLGLRHDASRYFAGVTWEGAAAQRHESEFEQETSGYSLLHATAGLRWTMFGRLHTLTLQANNVLDTVWRDHLSRIKVVAPQPGRNIQLLYRLNF